MIVLLPPHQDGTKPARRCNHTTWSLVDLRVICTGRGQQNSSCQSFLGHYGHVTYWNCMWEKRFHFFGGTYSCSNVFFSFFFNWLSLVNSHWGAFFMAAESVKLLQAEGKVSCLCIQVSSKFFSLDSGRIISMRLCLMGAVNRNIRFCTLILASFLASTQLQKNAWGRCNNCFEDVVI